MQTTPEKLLTRLNSLDIYYDYYEHPAVYTVEQARQHCGHIPGGHCKNLFLRDKKKRNWLLVLADDASVNLKQFGKSLGVGSLGFASAERLLQILGVIPGAVTPLALINDRECSIKVIVDRNLMSHDLINFHPLVNTATVSLSPAGLLAFIEACGHSYEVLQLPLSAAAKPA